MRYTRYLMLLSLLAAATQADITLMPSYSSRTVNEDGGPFDICLDFNPSPSDDAYTIMYDVTGTATDPSDYSIFNDTCMIEILANDTSPVCITVDVIDDEIIERNESFRITFSGENITFANNSVDIIITDNDGDITVAVSDNMDVQEGETISLCADASTDNYNFSFSIMLQITNGTANASDVMLSSNELQFSAGDTTKCFNITIVEDDGIEPQQYLDVAYSVVGQPTNVVLSSDATRIFIASQLEITVPVTSIAENAQFCAVLNGPSDGSVTVNYTIVDITTSSDDFDNNMQTGILMFPDGDDSSCLNIINDDSIVENTESFDITFHDPVGATAPSTSLTISITDNDAASIGFNDTTITITENSNLNLTTSINKIVAFDFTIFASSHDGTANGGSDFEAIANMTYNWITSSTPIIDITLINDDIVEYDESFNVTITSSRGNIMVSQPTVTVTIMDDDTSVIDTPTSVSVTESERSRTICFSISHQIAPKVNEANSNYNLSYTLTGTATEDDASLTPVSPLIIPSLSTDNVCFTVNIVDDDVIEEDETITLTWALDPGLPAGVMLQSPNTTITIISDDVSTTSTSIATPTSTSIATPSTPTSTSTAAPVGILNTITLIGIIVGVVAAGLLCLLILCCVVLCVKVRFNRQGFYFTEEDKGDAPRMLRYSASLRSISSQTVLPMDTREKENEYMV